MGLTGIVSQRMHRSVHRLLFQVGCYHKFIKVDLRIYVKNYFHNKNLKIQLVRGPFPVPANSV